MSDQEGSSENSGKMRRKLMRFALVTGVLVLGVLVILATHSDKRSYLVEARSWGGTLKFVGAGNHWMFTRALKCVALETPDLRAWQAEGADDRAEEICPRSRFEKSVEIRSETISWQSGTRVHFRQTVGGDLVIRVLDGAPEDFPIDSIVVVPRETWAEHGALTFSGVVQIGDGMGPNARGYLLEGYWEARQTGRATSLFRDITEVVQSGELGRGASVRVVKPDSNAGGRNGDARPDNAEKLLGPEDVVSYGHITPMPGQQEGMGVAVLTERGSLALEVQYFGLASPALFRPDWMDTVASSPVLIALGILLAFVLTVLEIGTAIWGGRKSRDEE